MLVKKMFCLKKKFGADKIIIGRKKVSVTKNFSVSIIFLDEKKNLFKRNLGEKKISVRGGLGSGGGKCFFDVTNAMEKKIEIGK